MHFSILLCHTSMHCWKDASGMPVSSIVTALLMASTSSKQVPLMIPLSLGKRKVTHSKIRWIGRFFQYNDVLLGQELPDAQGIVSRCIVVVKQPQFVLPQLSLFLSTEWSKRHRIDWLMITYIALACDSTWVTRFYSVFCLFVEYPLKWCTYSTGVAGATWNCSRLGASSVYTIQPCSMSHHAKPHT